MGIFSHIEVVIDHCGWGVRKTDRHVSGNPCEKPAALWFWFEAIKKEAEGKKQDKDELNPVRSTKAVAGGFSAIMLLTLSLTPLMGKTSNQINLAGIC